MAVLFLSLACDTGDMKDHGRVKPHEPTPFFPDGQSARHPVAGTISRNTNDLRPPSTQPITAELLRRGRDHYNIFCSVCHGEAGYGDGMIVRRGFVQPPSFHIDRLRNAPPDHIFNVITNGYGAMYSYSDRVDPTDRWAIAAYIRALQLSQRADLNNLNDEDRRKAQEATRK